MRTAIIVLAVLFSTAALFVTALTLSLPDRKPAGGRPDGTGHTVTPPPLPQRTAGNSPPRRNEGGEGSPPVLHDTGRLPEEEGDSGSEETLQFLQEQAAYRSLVSDLRQNVAVLEDKLERSDRDHEIERLREEQSAHGEEVRRLREELALLQEAIEPRKEEERVAAAPAAPAEDPNPSESLPAEEAVAPAGADPTPPPFRVVEAMEGKGRVIAILGGGAFPSGREVALEDLRQTIRSLLPEIVVNADALIVIEGHADGTPTRPGGKGKFDNNMALSLKRAEHIALLFEQEGIDSARIVLTPFGDTRPLAPNSTADGRAENRRVEIRLVPGGRGERD